jgi:hypothetical protein
MFGASGRDYSQASVCETDETMKKFQKTVITVKRDPKKYLKVADQRMSGGVVELFTGKRS